MGRGGVLCSRPHLPWQERAIGVFSREAQTTRTRKALEGILGEQCHYELKEILS